MRWMAQNRLTAVGRVRPRYHTTLSIALRNAPGVGGSNLLGSKSDPHSSSHSNGRCSPNRHGAYGSGHRGSIPAFQIPDLPRKSPLIKETDIVSFPFNRLEFHIPRLHPLSPTESTEVHRERIRKDLFRFDAEPFSLRSDTEGYRQIKNLYPFGRHCAPFSFPEGTRRFHPVGTSRPDEKQQVLSLRFPSVTLSVSVVKLASLLSVSFFSKSFRSLGFALPFVAFITSPTKCPKSFSFPLR